MRPQSPTTAQPLANSSPRSTKADTAVDSDTRLSLYQHASTNSHVPQEGHRRKVLQDPGAVEPSQLGPALRQAFGPWPGWKIQNRCPFPAGAPKNESVVRIHLWRPCWLL